jgi:hypothetical protein
MISRRLAFRALPLALLAAFQVVHAEGDTLSTNVNVVSDYRVAVTKRFDGGWSLSAAAVGADNDTFFQPPVGGLSAANGDTRERNKPVLVPQVSRNF